MEENQEVIGSGHGSLDWTAFNVNFHSSTDNIHDEKYQLILETDGQRIIDLRAFMIPRPHTVFENDSIQKCLDIFRLMNLKQLPVLSEDSGSIVGIITR